MGNQVISKPDAIRAAGDSISGLDAKSAYSKLPAALSLSDGLAAEEINEIIVEIRAIEGLIEEILKNFPQKLDKVAKIMEDHDNAAASQFK